MGIFGFGNNSVYYPGCYSLAKLKNKVENYKRILKKIGISSNLPEDFQCCTGVLINAGYDKQARKIARDNLELFKKQKITTIITNCPLCLKTFSKDYQEMMPDWDIHVEFILATILTKLRDNPKLIKNHVQGSKIVYHDACYLGRYAKLYRLPRQILELLGYEVIEPSYTKEESQCSGACSNLRQVNKELADQIAGNFMAQIKKTKINKIVTADPYAYIHLTENSGFANILVLEFSDIICDALGIKKK